MEENTGFQQADEIAAVASKADFAIYFGDANDYAYDDSSCEENVFVLFCSALDAHHTRLYFNNRFYVIRKFQF
jgi:hypothetical protein